MANLTRIDRVWTIRQNLDPHLEYSAKRSRILEALWPEILDVIEIAATDRRAGIHQVVDKLGEKVETLDLENY